MSPLNVCVSGRTRTQNEAGRINVTFPMEKSSSHFADVPNTAPTLELFLELYRRIRAHLVFLIAMLAN